MAVAFQANRAVCALCARRERSTAPWAQHERCANAVRIL